MVFQSLEYLLFLLALLATFFWLPRRGQTVLLFIASYIFYGWVHPWYLVLIGVTTAIDWRCALGIQASDDLAIRKRWLLLSVVVNFSILGAFKYFGFFAGNVTALLAAFGLMPSPWVIHIALPAGISFFTFQSAAYVIDVYRRESAACPSLLRYATYLAFFPQLVAGPIERAGHLLAQFEVRHQLSLEKLRLGFVLLLWGLVQKLVIADNAALLADKVFSLAAPSFPVLWGGVIAFGVQIYADFSGYTDMARGSARMLGFEICPNFADPYLAQSPPEFWRRWHMSLSTWFRDYVFIPLGGSRASVGKVARNLFITFLLSGLWHGASWNFILWGAYHGVLVAAWPWVCRALPILAKGKAGWLGTALRVGLTVAIAHLGWLMFREHSLAMLWRDLWLNPLAASASDWRMGLVIAAQSLLYGLPLLLVLPLARKLSLLPSPDDQRLNHWPWVLAQAAVAMLCVLLLCALRCSVGSDFIYFQF